MSPVEPLNNQDNLSRTQSGAELKGAESGKAISDDLHTLTERKRTDEEKDEQVNELNEQDPLNPDEQGNGQNKKQQSQNSETSQNLQTGTKRPGNKFMGGTIFDATV